MRVIRSLLVAVVAVILVLPGITQGQVAARHAQGLNLGNFVCSTGTILSPTVISAAAYQSLTISGICALPASGQVTVAGDLTITPAGSFNAVTPATIAVQGNVWVTGGSLFLGCSAEAGCVVTTTDTVGGNLIASSAIGLVVHNAVIGGNLQQTGGGGGPLAQTCTPDPLFSSVFGPYTPVYSDYEDTAIDGNAMFTGVSSCYFAFIRNGVGKNVNLLISRNGDPDGNEVVSNEIVGSLTCLGNAPAPQVGDSQGNLNLVGGPAFGQCSKLKLLI